MVEPGRLAADSGRPGDSRLGSTPPCTEGDARPFAFAEATPAGVGAAAALVAPTAGDADSAADAPVAARVAGDSAAAADELELVRDTAG
jgi:hypothetical protein